MAADPQRGTAQQPAPALAGPFDSAALWRGADLPDDAGRLILTADAIDEIDEAVALLEANPLPVHALRGEQFRMPACRRAMDAVRDALHAGRGFAILDRLPVERIPARRYAAVHWLLCTLLARPVAQKWQGDLTYEVTDTGRPPGNGVRPDKTNAEQNFHTDNSYNLCPPDVVSLFCVRTAMQGGQSLLVSFADVHERLAREVPALLARLYQPFVFDRQREHAAHDAMTIEHALFENDHGRLLARLSRFQVANGYALAGKPIDPAGAAALQALEEAMNAPGQAKAFWFEPGQIQFVHNRLIGHRRTAFRDWPDAQRKRLLYRLWLRDWGRPFYNG